MNHLYNYVEFTVRLDDQKFTFLTYNFGGRGVVEQSAMMQRGFKTFKVIKEKQIRSSTARLPRVNMFVKCD